MENTEWQKKRLAAFLENREAPKKRLFTKFFKSRPEDYTNAEYVELDVFSSRDVVAPTLRDARTGTVVTQSESWGERRFRPSYIGLEEPILLYDLMRRLPGESDEQLGDNVDWTMRALPVAHRALRKFHNMMGLQIDLQCAQIVQTGRVSLKDDKGNVSYELDFGAKATHFPAAGTDWGSAGATPVDDITALCDTVAADGERSPAYLILGSDAFRNLLADATFQKNVKRDSLGLGMLNPQQMGLGETYYGWAMFGMHRLEIYAYNSTYTPAVGSAPVPFLGANKAVVLPREDDLDFRTIYGGIPSRGMVAPFADAFPSVVTYSDDGSFLRAHNRVYWDEKSDCFTVESKCRPLSVPVSIDRWGCLKTKA